MTEWERHIRYLELRLAQCTARPELHRHQIPALRGLLDLARTDRDSYVSRSGHLFSLMRAEWLDRYQNLSALHEALGDERQRQAAEIAFRAGEEATSFASFTERIGGAMAAASMQQLAATTCNDSIAHLVVTLLEWSTEGDDDRRAVLAEMIRGVWRVIQRNDPGCSWDRVCSYPPYRNRLPFDAEGLRSIGSWLQQAVGTQLTSVPTPEPLAVPVLPVIATPDDPKLPSVADTARGYHVAHGTALQDPRMRRTLPIYERIFEIEKDAVSANHFLSKLVEEDLACELVRAHYDELIDDGLRHCAGLCQPHLERYYRELREALGRSSSSTELELEIARLDACLSIESSWSQVLLACAFRPVTTALCYELNPSEARRVTVENSRRTIDQLFGNWSRLFDASPVSDFFLRFFVARMHPEKQLTDDVYRGEVGLDLVTSFGQEAPQHAIGFIAQHGLENDEPIEAAIERRLRSQDFRSGEEARARISQLLGAATTIASTHTGSERGVILWGRHIRFDGIAAALSSPIGPC